MVLIRDKALGTGWNMLENKKQMAMTLNLMGSINLDSKALDGRFDVLLQYLKENEDEQPLVCDIITPIKFAKKCEFYTDVTEEEILSDLNTISYACHSEFSVELSRFIKMRIICQIQGPNCLIMIKMTTAGMKFFAVPIPQIPILNTALSNRLLNSESEMCTGFVSMNKSRKLVMLLENDPKVFNFPLVGIWVSGISTVLHPFVWASCLRYVNCSKYSERLCLPPQPFLLVLYSTLYCNPEFYDCTTKSGTCELSYNLYEGSAKTTLARVPMIDTKVTKVELFKVADKKKWKSFVNAEQQIKEMNLKNNVCCININDMPQICPHPQQLKIINPQPIVPDLSLSDSRNQQNTDICFSSNNNNKEITISEYLRNENKTSQNSVENTLLEKMQKCMPSNFFNTEKRNPICSQETSSRKSLIPIKQFPSVIQECDDKIKSITAKNNISNTRRQRRNELLNDETKTKEEFIQNAIPNDIYKLLQHQEEQLQLLQQQIQFLREQNENLTREVKVHSKCTKQAPLISVATMTSIDLKNENQPFHEKKFLVNEEIQTEAIQTNLCNNNITVGKKGNHCYPDKCCFPNNCNSKDTGEFTELSLEEFRLDTLSENHDNSFPSIFVDVPDYHTSIHSNCSNEEGLILGESASTKGNQNDDNEVSVQVSDKENDNTKREFNTSGNKDVKRTNQLYLFPEVKKNENASKKILYENFLHNINRFLVQTPNVELPISKTVLNSLQNWTAEVSLLNPEICWELEHLPKLSYPYTEISLSMATNALTLKYLGDDQLTKTFPSPENLTRSSDLTPYGLSPSNVSFATKRYLERHGLVTIGNFALDRETEDKCKY